MLENHPVLRERLLAFGALSAILVGGAVSVDTMLTSGWQFGGDDNNARPVMATAYAGPQQYFDDVTRNWSAPVQRRVRFADIQPASTDAPLSATGSASGLDGGPQTQASPPASPDRGLNSGPAGDANIAAEHDAATQSFDQIEAQLREADPQAVSPQPDAPSPKP